MLYVYLRAYFNDNIVNHEFWTEKVHYFTAHEHEKVRFRFSVRYHFENTSVEGVVKTQPPASNAKVETHTENSKRSLYLFRLICQSSARVSIVQRNNLRLYLKVEVSRCLNFLSYPNEYG